MAKINIHAGHAPAGKQGSGAVGIVQESVVDREIKNAVVKKLRALGHNVYDCTCENGGTATAILKDICAKANAHKVDIDVSIHLNAGGGHGTEVLVYKTGGTAEKYAKQVLSQICALGFRNRGVKVRTDLYYLRHTSNTSILIETMFCDSQEDVNRYNLDKMADAIVKGLVGQTDSTVTASTASTTKPSTSITNTSSKNSVIANGQQHSINFTGIKIAVDGIRGTNTKKNGIRCVQHAMNLDYKSGLKEDGAFGTKSDKALGSHYVKKGETQYLVTAVEILLMLRGYDPKGVECPGEFGSGLEAAVYQYQIDNGLKPDKIAGAKTIKSLMGV